MEVDVVINPFYLTFRTRKIHTKKSKLQTMLLFDNVYKVVQNEHGLIIINMVVFSLSHTYYTIVFYQLQSKVFAQSL